jgi:hypothetical protein
MIQAKLWSDCGNKQVEFDATPWFRMATAEKIQELADCGWSRDYPADNVAHFMADSNDNAVLNFFHFLEWMPRQPYSSEDTNGFECEIDANQAIEWLKVNRPEIQL